MKAAMFFFGNGYGMGAPFFDQEFWWLVDTVAGPRSHHSKGRFYTWIGGLGAQLNSFEWRRPREGTVRRLAGLNFTLFNASRGRFGLMWSVSWAADLPRDLNDKNQAIRQIKARLGRYDSDGDRS